MAMSKTGLLIVTTFWITCQFHGSVQQLTYPAQIGSPCGVDDTCSNSIPNSICRDMCICIENFIPNSDNKKCLPVAKNFNDSCEEQIQCTQSFGVNGTCSGEKCICKPENHFITPSQCIFSRGLGEECSERSQCFLQDDGLNQNIVCEEKQCKCRTGYTPTPDERSCQNSGVTNTISIICLVGVWILHLVV